MTTRSSASTRSPNTTTRPAGGRGRPTCRLYVNLGQWDKLPKTYQAIIQTAACADANIWMLGKYDADNVAALQAADRQRHAAAAVLEADPGRLLQGVPGALCRRTRRENPKFKKIYEPWKKFLADAGPMVPGRRAAIRQLTCTAKVGTRPDRPRTDEKPCGNAGLFSWTCGIT